ncbi:hypothetical protein DYB28_007049 [Aphanomyces astaci]|uniref:Myb/SANT-like domain-containing protein n=1 Tax=Aphanomyces astaci TaxID=112090 RepID=A0A9X8HBL3_APHAT|nr:hypothetical protein DYB28_007049 [Aphanomyces astaci]
MGIWNDELDLTWLKELEYQCSVLGKRARSGYKKEAWSAALKTLNTQHQLSLTTSQLKSRHDVIKGAFAVLSKIVDSSGMGWEADTCRVECQSTTWEEFMQGKPKSWGSWKNKRFPQFYLCERLFGSTLARGRNVHASTAEERQAFLYDDDDARSEHELSTGGDSELQYAPEGWRRSPSDEDASQRQRDDSRDDARDGARDDSRENATRSRISANDEDSVPSKRRRSTMASQLSQDFRAIADQNAKELELFARALGPPVQASNVPHCARAIEVLQADFEDMLSVDELVKAFEVMENETKALMFLHMNGPVREAWIRRQISQFD